MVAIRIDARCLSCDSVDMLEQTTEDDGVEYITCGFCGHKRELIEVQKKLTEDYNKFMTEGVKAVTYKKGGWFL